MDEDGENCRRFAMAVLPARHPFVERVMRELGELIDTAEPGIDLVREWLSQAENSYEVLPPSSRCGECLHQTQVTTRSPMGAIVYETGGILVDNGWLRFLGSGHPRFSRDLPGWNKSVQGDQLGCFLVADDVLGGFFAINGGALGSDSGKLYYLPYDGLDWEPLEIGFSQLFCWSLSGKLAQFYGNDRWANWARDVANLGADQCFSFYPFLFTKEGSVNGSHRGIVPVLEAFNVKMEFRRQLGTPQPPDAGNG